MAEELSSQAEQLQETIGFFSLNGGETESMDRRVAAARLSAGPVAPVDPGHSNGVEIDLGEEDTGVHRH
jgi:hypothetical protein